jgi:hypothetical protein
MTIFTLIHIHITQKTLKQSITMQTRHENLKRSEAVATSVQLHSHTFTCHKGNSGKSSCRMSYPQELRTEETDDEEVPDLVDDSSSDEEDELETGPAEIRTPPCIYISGARNKKARVA